MHSACFLVPSDPSAKPNLRALREADALQEAGWSYELDSVRMGPAPVGGFVSRAAYFKEYTRALSRMPLTVDPPPDIIISHDVYTLPAGRIAARKLGVPLIYDCHEPWPELIREHSPVEAWVTKWIERYGHRIDHTFVPCRALADRFSPDVSVLYNARSDMDIIRIRKEIAKGKLGFDEDDFILGYIGALEQLKKGGMYMYLLKAMEELPENVKLVIVSSPEGDQIRQDAEALGLSKRVRVEGPQPFTDLAVHYSALDTGLILLTDTPYYKMALPNKLWDFMAFGVPVVAPDYPEMARIIRLHNSGLLLLGWEHQKTRFPMLKGMLTVAQERLTSMEEMGQNGRKTFLENCWEVQAKKFMRVINQLTGIQ